MQFKIIKDLFFRNEKWLETVAITLIIILFCRFLNNDDPFFLDGSFPWPWIAPLILALRYGVSSGIASSSILVVFLIAGLRQDGHIEDIPVEYILGGILFVLMSGQYSTVWQTRLRRADTLGSHAGAKFEQLSKAYFMIRLSHDRLEQNLISRPVTLRGAMDELRSMLSNIGGDFNDESASALMAILVHQCRVGSAAIYKFINGNLLEPPVAECGNGSLLKTDDLLLQTAMQSGNAAYQTVNSLGKDKGSDYLVAAPISTSEGNILGILLVEDMPFLSLHRETLQIMGVILAYFADHSYSAASARDLLKLYPDCPIMFGAELYKMTRLKRDLEIGSALASLTVHPHPRMDEISSTLERQQRGLDHSWRRNDANFVQFVTLMPFAGPAGLEGFRARIGDSLRRAYGIELGTDSAVTFRSRLLSAETPIETLADFLSES